MPLLVYSVSDFVAFTKIRSADVNSRFNDIKTLLNTTGLDDTNLQNQGITPTTKLKTTGATAGQFLGANGTSSPVWVNNPLTQQYNYILGSAAQVTAGTATNSTFVGITQADGDRLLVLPGYVTSEAWSITKKLFITGLGNTSNIAGAITLATGSSKTEILNLRTASDITINSGVEACVFNNIFLASGKTFIDNATANANYLFAMQET